MSINQVIVSGNLGADPELRYTPTGKEVATMRVAVTTRFGTGDDRREHTEWFTVISWGVTALNVSKYLKKGSPVLVNGRLQNRSWEYGGQKYYKTEIVANTVQFLGKKDSPKRDDQPREDDIDDSITFE